MPWSHWRGAFQPTGHDEAISVRDEVPAALYEPLRNALACLALGETGEGRIAANLRHWRHPALDDDYHAAFVAFLAEEGRHATTLRAWVRALGGTLPSSRWSATAFRHARHVLGPRTEMAMLLAAEVIALVCYGALADALPRGRFAASISRIARDEATHLAFHVEFFRAVLGPMGRHAFVLAWKPLAWMSALAAWCELGRLFSVLGVQRRDLLTRTATAVDWAVLELTHCGSGPLPSRRISI